jgi:predicted nucleic acid-binding protein
MGSLTCLTDPAALVVADASVIISLNATGCAPEIIRALPNRLVVVDVVPAELDTGRPRGRQDADRLNDLVAAGLLDITKLGDAAEQHFESLVVGPAAETLDDGEAATIAYAVAHGAVPLIDERKANRICAERFASLRVGCTVDIFAHPSVLHAIGQEGLADAVANALQVARMRVLSHHVEWVVGIIGPERAARCTSMARSLRQSEEKPRKSQT